MLNKENQDLWNLVFHEDNLYYNRLQVFLTAHTLLVAAISVIYGKSGSIFIIILISSLGIVLSIVWAYLQIRASKTLNNLVEILKKEESALFENVYRRKRTGLHKLTQTDILTILPFLVMIFWVVIALLSLFSFNTKMDC